MHFITHFLTLNLIKIDIYLRCLGSAKREGLLQPLYILEICRVALLHGQMKSTSYCLYLPLRGVGGCN